MPSVTCGARAHVSLWIVGPSFELGVSAIHNFSKRCVVIQFVYQVFVSPVELYFITLQVQVFRHFLVMERIKLMSFPTGFRNLRFTLVDSRFRCWVFNSNFWLAPVRSRTVIQPQWIHPPRRVRHVLIVVQPPSELNWVRRQIPPSARIVVAMPVVM